MKENTGWGPLWNIVLLAAIGLWADPKPNRIGTGRDTDRCFLMRFGQGFERVP